MASMSLQWLQNARLVEGSEFNVINNDAQYGMQSRLARFRINGIRIIEGKISTFNHTHFLARPLLVCLLCLRIPNEDEHNWRAKQG